MPQMTRGPLEPGVYWRRRVFVVLLALTLVFVVSEVLGLGGGDDPAPVATPVSTEPSTAPSDGEAADDPDTTDEDRQGRRERSEAPGAIGDGSSYEPEDFADPEGTCSDSDVMATPSVDDAVVLLPVTIVLSLRTLESEACTWPMSSDTLTVRIADSGGEPLWTTQECPAVVPDEDVVVRSAVATQVELTWNARESDRGCPTLADWAAPGDYTVDAAALGGEPTSAEFTLAAEAAPDETDGTTRAERRAERRLERRQERHQERRQERREARRDAADDPAAPSDGPPTR